MNTDLQDRIKKQNLLFNSQSQTLRQFHTDLSIHQNAVTTLNKDSFSSLTALTDNQTTLLVQISKINEIKQQPCEMLPMHSNIQSMESPQLLKKELKLSDEFMDNYEYLLDNVDCIQQINETVESLVVNNHNSDSPPKKLRKLDSGMGEMQSKIPSSHVLRHKK